MEQFLNCMRIIKKQEGKIKLILLWSEWFNRWEIIRRDQFNVLHKKLRLVYHKNYKSNKII